MWPFRKNDKHTTADDEQASNYIDEPVPPVEENVADEEPDFGPFDGDTVDIERFDFSDFSTSTLDLGSLRIPLPRPSEVQVEMGENGPRMLHIVTRYGRLTPVAFAAAASEQQWPLVVDDISAGMANDGLDVHYEEGPWGTEIVGTTSEAVIRMIGCDGSRWMLRTTLAGPKERADDLRNLAHDVLARTFVYRGTDPIMAGNSLPVVLPEQLARQVQDAMNTRAQQASEGAVATSRGTAPGSSASQQQPAPDAPGVPNIPSPEESSEGSALQQLQARAHKENNN